MSKKNKIFASFLLVVTLWINVSSCVFAQVENKNPNYVQEFLGEDKFENFNRKMFTFNSKLNKYALRPINIVWASIMPKYGMDRLQGVYSNVLYPRRLLSTLIQRDFSAAGGETLRFLINSTVGLGGMFDPAKKYLKIEQKNADMEQALAKCNIKQGPYLVCPILNATSPRGLIGWALDTALDPSSYLGIPFMALVKLGFTVNKIAYLQPMLSMIESNYADPYDIARTLYGIDNFIKNSNVVEKKVSGELVGGENSIFVDFINQSSAENYCSDYVCFGKIEPEKSIYEEVAYQSDPGWEKNNLWEDTFESDVIEQAQLAEMSVPVPKEKEKSPVLKADIFLTDYNSQGPVIDAMRTVFFDLPGIDESIWSELSIWNRSFAKRIKTSAVNLSPSRDDYKFRYILQKDKNSPVVIIYPSIGEGYTSHHSVVLAKLFYEQGYSAIIMGSHFQWEFVKSMPVGYKPGIPGKDIEYLQMASAKIVDFLQSKYECEFKDKVVVGTSFGAMMTLYLAEKESRDKVLEVSKYISINPPVDLIYAMNQFDQNSIEWKQNPDELKDKAALIAAKIKRLLDSEELKKLHMEKLPFNEDEAKLITGFVMHQKLSDLIFAMENGFDLKDKSKIYKMINKMNYHDYVEKYMIGEEYKNLEEISKVANLYLIGKFLKSNDNYKIYHSIDDYLVTSKQLGLLKSYCGENLVLMSNGSHLGFLYRPEFIDTLRHEILMKNNQIKENI